MTNQELLIDHLDKTIQGESLPEAEALLASDSNALEEWQYLQTAVEAAQHTALYEKVGAIRAEMKSAKVISIQHKILRVAAAIVLLLGVVTVYKYKFASVSADEFYNEHYTSYTLSTSRGGAEASQLEQAYRNNNWNEVVTQYNALAAKNSKDHFLAGMAAMELKQYQQSIERFNLVLNNSDGLFQDEAEYYLALAYIADKQPEEAKRLLRKIESDNGHSYQQKVKEMKSDLNRL